MLIFKILCVILVLSVNNANADIDITFKTYEMCKGSGDTPMKYSAKFTKVNSTVHLMDTKAYIPYDLDKDVTIDIIFDMFKNDEWKQVLNISRKDPCPLINKYGGETLFELQKKLNVEPGVCPIPKGTYELKDYLIDFGKLNIKNIPKALFKSNTKLTRNGELLLCFNGEFESN